MHVGSIDALPPSPVTAREGVVVSGAPSAGSSKPTPPNASSSSAPSAAAVKAAVERANETLHAISQAVEFAYDEDAKQTVVRVVDTEDHQVLRQIPAPEMLEIARALERMQSLLIRAKA